VDVRVLYGNVHGNGTVSGDNWNTRKLKIRTLVLNSGCQIFCAVEMHEEDNQHTDFLTVLKAVDTDWALFVGKSGNHTYYRPSSISQAAPVVVKRMPGSRDMTDFRVQDNATAFQFHLVLNHFRANDPDYKTPKTHQHRDGKTRGKERNEQADFVVKYVGDLQSAVILGDFNSSTDKAVYPRAKFKAAGFTGLREKSSVTNGKRSTRSKSSNAHFWIEDIFTRKAQTVSQSALILTNDASDHNGFLVTTITWPAVTTVITPGVAPVTSTNVATYSGVPWEARVRNTNLTVGPPVKFTRAELVENYCGVPMLTLTGRTSDLDVGAAIGSGIILTDDQGGIRLSGPLWSFSRSGKQAMTLIFRGDTVETAGRIVWPNPSAPWTKSGQTSAYQVVSGPAETRLLAFLSTHLGASARTERKLTTLRQPASLGRGPNAVTSARFDILGQLIAMLAESANLHFGIRQAYDGSTPYLEFYLDDAPDLSDWVRFGTPEAGGPYMLSDDWGYTGSMPAGTTILGAAGGELTDRILTSITDPAAEALWNRRVEFFLDQRGSTDATEIAAGLAKSLNDNGAGSKVSVPLGSVPGLGTTIPLGAVATASLDGELVTDRIRQITTVLSSEDNQPATQVGGVLGTPDAGVKSPTWLQLQRMLTRLQELERR
jgi:hypothetical protein